MIRLDIFLDHCQQDIIKTFRYMSLNIMSIEDNNKIGVILEQCLFDDDNEIGASASFYDISNQFDPIISSSLLKQEFIRQSDFYKFVVLGLEDIQRIKQSMNKAG